MRSAVYFAPPARHAPRMRLQSIHEMQSADAAPAFTTIEEKEAFRQKAFKLLLVAGLHVGVFALLAQTDTGQPVIQQPVRLEVRTMAMPDTAPVLKTGIAEEVREQPKIAKPVAPRVKQPASQNQLKAVAPPKPQPAAKPLQDSLTTPSSEAAASASAAQQTTDGTSASEKSGTPAPAASSASGAGGATTAARFDADYLKNPAPDYPPASRRMREEGTVYLDVNVTAEGRAGDLRIKKSSGYARLDEAALDAVRQWRFIPARSGADAVAAHVVVPVVFRLGS